MSCALTTSERAMLLLYELSGRSGGYNLRCPLVLAPHVDSERLRAALASLVQRHPALHSRLAFEHAQPVRVFDAPAPALRELRLELSDEVARDRWLALRSLEPFALFDEAPARFDLLRARCAGVDSVVLLLTVHHVAADYASLQRLVAELERAYQRQELPDVTHALASHCTRRDRESSYLAGAEAERDTAYWRQHLLPLHAHSDAAQRFEGMELRRELPASLASALRTFARTRGSTPFAVALTAFSLEHPDEVLGTPLDVDPAREPAGGVGYFVNTVMLRLRGEGDHSFAEHVRQTNAVLARALRHGRLPFAALVERLGLSVRGGVPRLHEAMLTWLRFAPEFVAPPVPERVLLDVLELQGLQPAGCSHRLVLTFEERGERLCTLWAFQPSAHTDAAVAQQAERYFERLARLLRTPDVPLRDLSLAPRAASREHAEL